MKQNLRIKIIAGLLLMLIAAGLFWARHSMQRPKPTAKVLGLVVTMAEDGWKEEQVSALRDAAAAHGMEVISIETARNQKEQMDAIRALVVYRVDAIVFSPVVESGWDTVLQEAKAAEIPVVAVDKALHPRWGGMDTSYVGFDYNGLAVQAAQKLIPINGSVAELYGTLNSYNAREITRGFREVLDKKEDGITYSMCGDYMRSRGAEIMDSLLRRDPKIRVVISHNDAMTLGAIDVIRAHKLQPGKDILLCSFGGGEDMMKQYREGTVNIVVRCENHSLAEETVQAIEDLWKNPGQLIRRTAHAEILDKGGNPA